MKKLSKAIGIASVAIVVLVVTHSINDGYLDLLKKNGEIISKGYIVIIKYLLPGLLTLFSIILCLHFTDKTE
jgi:hypothetical protein